MKSFIFSLLAASSILAIASSQAEAARYIVGIKEQNIFSRVADQVDLSQMNSIGLFGNREIQVSSAMRNLQMLVVQTDSSEAITKLATDARVEFVEAETFIPAPKPIEGFTRTQPWDLSAEYLAEAPINFAPSRPWGITSVKAAEAWSQGAKGQGIRIAVLDSGIDKDHPSLSSAIESMRDLVGDGNSPYPAADQVGHGTHVAGTIAGRISASGFSGVAPEAKLLVGRVCGTSSCSMISVISGIDWAVSAKARIISMSLGSQMASSAEKMAVERAASAGVMVIAASGNSAEDYPGRVGYPAAFPTVMAVGATDSANARASFSQYGTELDIMGPGVDVLSSVPMGSGRVSVVQVDSNGQSNELESRAFNASKEANSPISGKFANCGMGKSTDSCNASGKIALIKRGEITFGEKAQFALRNGARAVVIYNNTSGIVNGTLSQDGTVIPIVAVGISQADGENILAGLSRGQDVSGTVRTDKTDYASFSGTSMATPHVSGVAALVLSKKPSLRPSEVKRALESTATKIGSATEYASGLVNAEKAVESVK